MLPPLVQVPLLSHMCHNHPAAEVQYTAFPTVRKETLQHFLTLQGLTLQHSGFFPRTFYDCP